MLARHEKEGTVDVTARIHGDEDAEQNRDDGAGEHLQTGANPGSDATEHVSAIPHRGEVLLETREQGAAGRRGLEPRLRVGDPLDHGLLELAELLGQERPHPRRKRAQEQGDDDEDEHHRHAIGHACVPAEHAREGPESDGEEQPTRHDRDVRRQRAEQEIGGDQSAGAPHQGARRASELGSLSRHRRRKQALFVPALAGRVNRRMNAVRDAISAGADGEMRKPFEGMDPAGARLVPRPRGLFRRRARARRPFVDPRSRPPTRPLA